MDEAVERVATAIRDAQGCGLMRDGQLGFCDHCDCKEAARAALQAAIPIIGEEMARVAEAEKGVYPHGNMMYGPSVPPLIAQAIRSHAQHLVGKVGEGA